MFLKLFKDEVYLSRADDMNKECLTVKLEEILHQEGFVLFNLRTVTFSCKFGVSKYQDIAVQVCYLLQSTILYFSIRDYSTSDLRQIFPEYPFV
jgi:hypothetical protein